MFEVSYFVLQVMTGKELDVLNQIEKKANGLDIKGAFAKNEYRYINKQIESKVWKY